MNEYPRREFLRTGFMVTAAALAAGSLGSAAFAFGKSSQSEPFEMLVIGDSIMWGQGLNPEEKFSYLIEQWLEKEILKRDVNRTVEAHSGATIFPEKDPKRYLTEEMNEEINVSNPPILFQVESALDTYKKDPLEKRSKARVGEKVDLILLDGGANDFGMSQIVFSTKINDKLIEKYARDYCLYGMTTLLRVVCPTFPNARIVVTGYYPLVSKMTNPNVLSRSLFGALGIDARFNMPFHKDGDKRDKWADRSAAWVKWSNKYLQEAIEKINEVYPWPNGPRILFAPIPFEPQHSYGTFKDKEDPAKSETLLWYMGKRMVVNDRRYNDRRETICTNSEDAKFLSKLQKKICIRAGAFHPNWKGAEFYAEQIKKALLPYVDDMKAQT